MTTAADLKVAAGRAERRARVLTIAWYVAAIAGGAWVVVVIAVLSQMTTPLPDWVPWFFAPLVVFAVAGLALKAASGVARNTAALAGIRASAADIRESLAELEEIERNEP